MIEAEIQILKGSDDMHEEKGILQGIAKALFALLGGLAGYQIAQYMQQNQWLPWTGLPQKLAIFSGLVLVLALVGYFVIAPLFIRLVGFIGLFLEHSLQSLSWQDISMALAGLIIGLIIANLLALPFVDLPGIGIYLAVVLNIMLGYLGIHLFLRRKDEIMSWWSSFGTLKEHLTLRKGRQPESAVEDHEGSAEKKGTCPKKILDTSVIIDGRILDIAKTGFLEGVFLLPQFVLAELQAIADSSDPTRRTKGRRGLDIVKELQEVSVITLNIVDVSLRELGVESVDDGLLALAKRENAAILTTDYNLNKIAQIQGVQVMNVNDLANAMKPILLPGETVVVDIIREGKEPNQGVGYLDDGTMLVIEDGEGYIGKRVEVTVTSILQTSAGRMIFGRMRREVR